MLNIGFGELLLLVALVLILVGPERLPHMMRSMGRMYGKLRRQSDELRRALMAEADLMELSDRRASLRERQRQIQRARGENAEAAARGSGPVVEDPDALEPTVDTAPELELGDTTQAEQALADRAARTLPEGVVPRDRAETAQAGDDGD